MHPSKPISKNNPKVSISVITYNHANYIEQALESVLMQETDFDYEIIIGEDDSTDGTRDIVQSYQKKYPDTITVLLNERENVIYIDGKPTGRRNLINNLQHCKGEYIALLEGDDYWTDLHKLQKQVEFLDKNLDYSMCFHKVLFVSEESNVDPVVYQPYKKKRSYTLEDLIQKNFIATLSVVYRNLGFFSNLPQWYYSMPVGDYPLHLLAAEKGSIGYLDDQMGVRRVHKSGYWSSMSLEKKHETALKIYAAVDQYFEVSEYSKVARSSLYYTRYRYDYARKKYSSSVENLVKCLCLVPGHISVHDRGLIKSILDIFIPVSMLSRAGRIIRTINRKFTSAG